MRIVIVNAPSGVALTQATNKIEQLLNNQSGDQKFCSIVDLESEIIPLYLADHPEARLGEKGQMQNILYELPRDAVTEYYWPLAAKNAFKKLLETEAEIRILRCHLTYYRSATREFYPSGDLDRALSEALAEKPGNSKAISPKIDLVVTLIDDVFDMFHRLSIKGEVFPLETLVKDEYRRRIHEGREPPNELSKQYVLAFEQVITVLHRLLEWRSREMTSGDVLATRVDAAHFVMGIKHSVDMASRLVCLGRPEDNSVPVYLSHPISRPRKHQKAQPRKDWGPFVREFQSFVETVSEVEVNSRRALFFMPTSIDEYRFTDRAATGFPCLERRWPLPQEELLYSLEGYGSYDHFETTELLEELFNPVGAKYDVDSDQASKLAPSYDKIPSILNEPAKDEVLGLIGGLLQQIRIQLSIRDHSLVRQTGRLLLYRPYFEDGRFSGGVRAELDNWSTLSRTAIEFGEKGRKSSWPFGPAVLVHDTSDLIRANSKLEETQKTGFRTWVSNRLSPEKLESFDFDRISGPPAYWFDRAIKPDDELLGGRGLSQADRDVLRDEFNASLNELVSKSQRLAYAGGATDGRHFFIYERLGEKTQKQFKEIAEREIISTLIGDYDMNANR